MDSAAGTCMVPARYRPLFSLAWLHFLNDGAANFLPGILPLVLVAIHRPPALAGTLMFALLAGQALQPLTGLLGRPLGGRRLMWTGLISALLGAALVGWTSSLVGLVMVLVLIGIANACFHPQALSAARRFAGSRGHFGVAVMMLGGEIGRGLWPLIASLVVVGSAFHNLWMPALAGLITVPLAARLLPAPVVRSFAFHVHIRGRVGAACRLLLYAAVRGGVVTGAVTYMPILWDSRGGGLVGGATLVTLMLLIGIVGMLYGGHLADRLGRRPVLVGAGLLMAGCTALIASGSGTALWLGASLLGIPAFATFPVTTVEGQDLFPDNRPFGSGIALGLGNALGAGLAALLGLSVGVIALQTLFWLLTVGALATMPLALLLQGHMRTEEGR
ncbi:MAG TPA: MFS transporter [Gammaproteobacteria bacterium]|nr:MFS transporter [Gammaproteobacteria bacterium]